MKFTFTLCLFTSVVSAAAAVEPWATYRGNSQRTGNTDGVTGPATPKILWALKSKDHYIASPVPAGDLLLVSSLGALNAGTFSCLSTDPAAKERLRWCETTPLLRSPTVSSPALCQGKLVFGDGMHQSEGASLYCLDLAKGSLVWQHAVPGDLVHLEGSPTIVDGKAYIGAGAGGILCVDINHVTLEGKPMDLADVQKTLDKRLKELQAKYEIDKKTDPFAFPPSEDQLPRASPNRLWQQGKDKWHVDAPVAVADGKVLMASAFLDKEQVGDRALYCLDAKSGNVLWRKPLKLNPWGGPSVQGTTVVVSGSSIGYDPNALKGAKGFIAAFDLRDGSEKWFKEVPGGVVACAALADGAAVVTATDGKVRAFNMADGTRRWIYDTDKAPLFAPVAIAKNSVYAGDLKGVLHAIDLKSGQKQWTLDLSTHPDVQSPSMVYGGPIVHGGRIYLATCNLGEGLGRASNVVVCIGEK